MVSALVGKRHGGARISGWGTGEARNAAKGENLGGQAGVGEGGEEQDRRRCDTASRFGFYLCRAASALFPVCRVDPDLVKRVTSPWANL